VTKDYFVAMTECHMFDNSAMAEIAYYPGMKSWMDSIDGIMRAWWGKGGREDTGGDSEIDVHQFPGASELVANMDKYNVDVAFCLRESMMDASGQVRPMSTNAYILSQIAPYSDRLYLEANVGPMIKRGMKHVLWELEYLVKERGAKLCKVYQPEDDGPINDKRLWPFYEKAQELGVPLTVHTGVSYLNQPNSSCKTTQLDDVMLDFPGLRVIAYHAGWPDTEELCNLCGKHPNLYMSLSGVISYYSRSPYRGYHAIGTAMQWMAPDKIVLGHDAMGTELGRQVDYIRNLQMPEELQVNWGYRQLTEEDKAKILGLNLAKLTGIEPTKRAKKG